jgi:nucleoporin POM152
MSFCLHESFTSQDDANDAGTVVLRGQPPFYLELSIRSLSSDELRKERVMISDFEWKVSIPEFTFKSVGSYLISLDSIKDESNCEEIQLSLESRSLIVNVAETAAVVPYDARQTYCVGEQLRFQLEGVPPWQVK